MRCYKLGLILCNSLLIMGLTACVNDPTPHFDSLTITTSPTGANCVAKNSLGKWYLHHTPGKLAVRRDHDVLSIICRKPGFLRKRKVLTPTVNDDYPANVHINLKANA